MKGKQILLKLTALTMVTVLLIAGMPFGMENALAGGSVSGSITVTELQTNTVLAGDTTITIDHNIESQSISGEGYNLKFVSAGGILELNNNSGPAVHAKDITFEYCRILYPAGAKIIDGTICNASGYIAQRVVIGPVTYRTINIVKGSAFDYDLDDGKELFYAEEGTKVEVNMDYPTGKYISGYSCIPSDLPLNVSLSSAWFVMGADDVTISPQYSLQVPGTLDIRKGKLILSSEDDRYMNLALAVAAGSMGLIKMISGKGMDLDKDGTPDIDLYGSDTLVALGTCSIPIAIDIKVPIVTKFNPLTIRFSDPKITFDLNGGSGTMAPDSVTALDWKYTLPDCKITPPVGKEFDKWDKGAPGTVITVKENTTVRALWKEQYPDEKTVYSKLAKVKLKAVSKMKLKISWKKLSKKARQEVRKIQIQVSTDPDFRNIVKTKLISSKKTSYTISGLKKNTKYYIRIRAYTEKDGIKYVSEWVIKSKKTKKK